MFATNHKPGDGESRDPLAELLTEAGELFRPPSPASRERIWAHLNSKLESHRVASSRRFRVGRIAIAASLMAVVVGLGGYAAGSGWFAHQSPDPHRVEAHHLPTPVIQQDSVTPQPNLVMRSPVANTSFLLTDGDHVLPLLPKDPLRPFANYDWFYPVPAHVTDCKFDPATRLLKFKLRQIASPAAVDRARHAIAHAYNTKGRAGVKPEDINIQPLQRVGYRLALDTNQGDLLLKRHEPGGPFHSGKMPVTAEIPSDYRVLIDNLTNDPDFVSLVATGYYDFEYSTSASAEAQGLRSASMKALEAIYGGKPPTGPVIVDRRGKQEYLLRMRNEVVLWAREYGMEAKSMTDLALNQLGAIEPISFRDFLDQRGQLMIWNADLGRLDLKVEEYNLLTQETHKLLEEQDQVRSLSKAISDLATHEQDEGKFYNRLQETFDLRAKASGSAVGIFSADLEMDLKKSYDQLSSSEKKSVSDYKRSASNESEFESNHIKKSNESFRGQNRTVGTTPKGWDLYLINDEATVGETLFGSHQVKLLDGKSVSISEEFPIEVEKVATEEPPPGKLLASTPANSAVPIGVPLPFPGRTESVPEGYLIADGREVRRDEYPELFRLISTIYGRGDGEKTFNLPDYRGEFIRGADDMGTIRGARGVDAGRTVGSSQTDAFRQHEHDQNLTVNMLHNHRVMDVYHISGGAGVLTHTDAGKGIPLSMNALIAGFPYGFARTPGTPVPPDGIPQGTYAGPEQPKPFDGGHKLKDLDSVGHAQDDRWAITTDVGNPKQPVEGSIGGAIKDGHAKETRPRNIAVLYIIRAK